MARQDRRDDGTDDEYGTAAAGDDVGPAPAAELGAAESGSQAGIPGAEVHPAPEAARQDQSRGAGDDRQPACTRRSAPGGNRVDRRRADAAQLARETTDQRRGARRSLRTGAARAAAAGPHDL